MKKTTQKKSTTKNDEDIWDFHPVKSDYNIVRLPLFDDYYDDGKSITFDKHRSTYSITELKPSDSELVSGICSINLDGEIYFINMTYRALCNILFA